MSTEVVDPISAAGIASSALDRSLSALQQVMAQAKAAAASATSASAAQAAVTALIEALGVNYRWSGTSLQLMLPDGTYGPAVDLQGVIGPVGPTPTFHIGTQTVGAQLAIVIDDNDPLNPIVDFTVPQGPPGWSPVFSLVANGSAEVLQVTDWTGGTGTKPQTGVYVGPTGYVGAIGSAVNLRGNDGSGTVTPTGTITAGHLAVFTDATGKIIQDGGAITGFGVSIVAAANAASVKVLLAIAAGDISGLGSLALQAASAVAITGGTVDGTPIGGTTPAAAKFTTLATSTPIPVSSGGIGTSTAGGGALDNVLGISGAGGGLLTRTGAGSYSFTATASFAASTITVTGAGALTGGGDLTANRTLDIAANGVTNAKLAQMAAVTLKGNVTGALANAADVTPSVVLDAAFGSTQGMLLYRGAAGWAALGVGTVGQLLQSGGAGANPSWVSAAASSDVRTGTDATKYVTSAALSGSQAFQALTDAATIAWNGQSGFNATVTLGGNRTLGAITNPVQGQTYSLLITQDGTGSRTLAYSTAYDFGAAGAPTLTTTSGKTDMLTLICVSASAPTFYAALNKGF